MQGLEHFRWHPSEGEPNAYEIAGQKVETPILRLLGYVSW